MIAGYGGLALYSSQSLKDVHLTSIVPDKISLVGLDREAGVKIIVANRVAQVVEGGSGKFGADASSDGGGATKGAFTKRIPIKELLAIFAGDSAAVGKFVMIMNDKREDDTWPTQRIVWKAEDLVKAFAGDKPLRNKLENDLNAKIDGTPLKSLNLRSFYNGIIIDKPVYVEVLENGQPRKVQGRVQEPYKPRFIAELNKEVENVNIDEAGLAGRYANKIGPILRGEPSPKGSTYVENIQKTITGLLSKDNSARLEESPNNLLRHAHVIVNSSMITSAESIPGEGAQAGKWTLKIRLNEEGRKRLWKFSAEPNRIGSPLLFIVNNVPIAAPQIQHELSQGELVITQLEDEGLVEDATNLINKK